MVAVRTLREFPWLSEIHPAGTELQMSRECAQLFEAGGLVARITDEARDALIERIDRMPADTRFTMSKGDVREFAAAGLVQFTGPQAGTFEKR